MIKVTVKLAYKSYWPQLPELFTNTQLAEVSVPEGTMICELLEKIKLPKHIPKLILVNGISVNSKQKLQEGDLVSIFPPLAGG